jgi:hypothetical protein
MHVVQCKQFVITQQNISGSRQHLGQRSEGLFEQRVECQGFDSADRISVRLGRERARQCAWSQLCHHDKVIRVLKNSCMLCTERSSKKKLQKYLKRTLFMVETIFVVLP